MGGGGQKNQEKCGRRLWTAPYRVKEIDKEIMDQDRSKKTTNERLIEHIILKLEDEIRIAELKIIWKLIKNRIPLRLKNITVKFKCSILKIFAPYFMSDI